MMMFTNGINDLDPTKAAALVQATLAQGDTFVLIVSNKAEGWLRLVASPLLEGETVLGLRLLWINPFERAFLFLMPSHSIAKLMPCGSLCFGTKARPNCPLVSLVFDHWPDRLCEWVNLATQHNEAARALGQLLESQPSLAMAPSTRQMRRQAYDPNQN